MTKDSQCFFFFLLFYTVIQNTLTRPDTRHKVLQNTFFRCQREGITDLRTDGWTDGPTDGPTDRRTKGPMDRRTDGRTDPLVEVLRRA